jgi:methylated-DNA-protein-cysteine methyltransferase-like protein
MRAKCSMHPSYLRIYAVVRQIPRGRVATYGQVAALAGLDGHGRRVGYALHSLPSSMKVPWHRVINARGEVSARTSGDSHELQRHLLEAEGIHFDRRGRIDLTKHRWRRLSSSTDTSTSVLD